MFQKNFSSGFCKDFSQFFHWFNKNLSSAAENSNFFKFCDLFFCGTAIQYLLQRMCLSVIQSSFQVF